MTTAVSQINERLSNLDKRINKIDSDRDVENKQTFYPLPENAGTVFMYIVQ